MTTPAPQIDQEAVHQETAWAPALAGALGEAHRRFIERQIYAPSNRGSNWASSLGHPCDLHLTFWRVKGSEAPRTPADREMLYREGHKQEELILQELVSMGLQIVERGVPISNDGFMRNLQIAGKLDARVDVRGLDKDLLEDLQRECPSVDWQHVRPVIECKSLSSFNFSKLVDYDAIMTDRRHYIRGWAEQMQLYLLGRNRDAGLFVFKNKVNGQLRFVPVLLDLETCEALAKKAERVNAAVHNYQQSHALPAPITWRQDICAECPFLAQCPNSREIPAIELVDDAELIDALERLEKLDEQVAEARELKELRDEKLERLEGQNAVIGGRWQLRWRKVETKERLTPAGSYWRKDITKLPEAVETIAAGARL